MKFREYDNVKPLVLVAGMDVLLQEKIEECDKKYDIIDLQFSSHYDYGTKREKYCALLLVKEKWNDKTSSNWKGTARKILCHA